MGFLSSVLLALVAAITPVTPPPAGGVADYQLGGAYRPAAKVEIVVRDRTEQPAPGVYSVCYVNAFQTQPGEEATWAGDAADLVLRDDAGDPVVDPDWPDEALLDLSTPEKRQRVADVVGGWIEGCADAGYDAVEADNLDSWTRSDGRLTEDDAVAYATLLADRAHASGLALAQKNAAEIVGRGVDEVGFDLAVAEECQVFDECDAYLDAYGTAVIEIEYADQPRRAFTEACALRGDRVSVLLRDRDVVPAGSEGYVSEHC